MRVESLARLARTLEIAVVALALLALAFRAVVYPLIEKPPGAAWGRADVIDFALAMLLFLLGGLCAATGVAQFARAAPQAKGRAYRPVLVGMTTFVVYYLIHPYVAALT